LSHVLVWVIWWVGMVYVCALVADLWALVNPFRTLFAWAEVIAEVGWVADACRSSARTPRHWKCGRPSSA